MNSISNHRRSRSGRLGTKFQSLLALAILALPATMFAQSRDFHVQGVVIGDGGGNTIKIQAPPGVTSYTLTLPVALPPGNYILTIDSTGAMVASSSASAIEDGAISGAKIADSAITNADVAASAAIHYSKLDLVNGIQNSHLQANSVTTSKVANGTVTTSKMADSAISGLKLLTNAVNTAHIADGAVTDAKVANGISYSKLSGAPTSLPPSGAAGGDLTGTYPNPVVAAGAVTSAKIADGTIVDADVSASAAIGYSKLSLANSIQNADIVANAITTSKVANGTVTTSKLADSAVSGLKLLTNAVNTAHIADGAVTDAKVANGISYSKLSGAPTSLPPSGAAGGDLTGTYPNPTVATDAISTTEIADGTITNFDIDPAAAIGYSKLNLSNSIQNADIVANAITTSKVANGTVTTSKLADSAVSGLKLLTNAVNTAHIADGAVTDAKVANGISYSKLSGAPTSLPPSGAAGGDLTGTYPNPTVATDAISTTEIADGTITNFDIDPAAAIGYSKLSLTNSIQNGDLTANSVTTSKVANGTVTTSKLADSAVSGLKLLTNAVETAHIADNAVTTAKISSSGASSGNVLTYNGTNVTWSSSSVNTNSTLTGNGTSGSPLAINLSNSNTWLANQTFSGSFLVTANARISVTNNDNNARDIRFQEPSTSGNQYVGFRSPVVSANGNYVLPASVGTTGQALTIASSAIGGGIGDSATLSWTTITATGAAGGDLTGTYPNPTIAADAVGTTEIADGSVTLPKISTSGASTGNILTYDGANVAWAAAPLSGAVVLSFDSVAAGASLTIPNNTAVVRVTDDLTASSANAVTMPSGTDGQVLYIYNEDADALTSGATTASGAVEKFIYINGGWHLVN